MNMSNNRPQIECHNLALGYDGKVVAEDISFDVVQGDYLCIVGENGAGKSTLIKTLLKLNLPISGQIIMNEELIKGGIGYLPQQTEVQRDFPASVREIVMSGCLKTRGFKPFYSKSLRQLAYDNMKKLGIKCAVQETREDMAADDCDTDSVCTGNCAGCDIDHSVANK